MLDWMLPNELRFDSVNKDWYESEKGCFCDSNESAMCLIEVIDSNREEDVVSSC